MEGTVFLSYNRSDAEFALRLAQDLRSADVSIWIDQIDIGPGDTWDRAVEEALQKSVGILVILSPSAVASRSVMDEVSFALDENKRVFPVLYRHCQIPFRLRRVQYTDFTSDYPSGLAKLIHALGGAEKPSAEGLMGQHLKHRWSSQGRAGHFYRNWAVVLLACALIVTILAVALLRSRNSRQADGQSPGSGVDLPSSRSAIESQAPGQKSESVSPMGTQQPLGPSGGGGSGQPDKPGTGNAPGVANRSDNIVERSYQFRGPFRISRVGDAVSFSLTDAAREEGFADSMVHIERITFTGYVENESDEPFGFDSEVLIFPDSLSANAGQIAATDYGHFLQLENAYAPPRRRIQLKINTNETREVHSQRPLVWSVDIAEGSATNGDLKFVRDTALRVRDGGIFVQLFLWTLWGGEHFVEFNSIELRVRFRVLRELD